MRRYPTRSQNYAQAGGVAWPDSGGSAPAGATSIQDVFGPRPFAAHIPTVGYDYDFHRGIDVDLAIGDPVYAPIGGALNRWHFTHFGFETDDHLAQWSEVDPGGRATFARVGTDLEIVGDVDGVQSFPTNCPYITLGPRVEITGEWAIELRTGVIAAKSGAVGVAIYDPSTGEYYAFEYDGATLQTLGVDSGGAITGWDGVTDSEANITELRLAHPDGAGTIEAQRNDNDAGLTLLRSRSIDSFTAATKFEAIAYYRSNAAGPGSETFTLDFINMVTTETIGRFGNWVQITDGSRRVALMHMREIVVSEGSLVVPGQQIGTIGRTGFDGRSGRIISAHAHLELIQDNAYFYFNDEPVNPLSPSFLPRADVTNNVTVTRTNENDPDAVDSWRLEIVVARADQDFDLNEVTLTGNLASRTINFNTRAGLNSDNDIPLESGVYIVATNFNELSASYTVDVYFHRSVVGTTFTSAEVRDTDGNLLWSE